MGLADQRVGDIRRTKPESPSDYANRHVWVWPDLRAALRRVGVRAPVVARHANARAATRQPTRNLTDDQSWR
jgi:hypothetical protein